MTTKTRKAVKAYERDAKVSLEADGANSRGGLFYGATEALRFTGSAITNLLATTFSAAVTFSGAVVLTGGNKTPVVKVTDATTYAVLAANSGKVHVVPDLTADCTLSLPTVADGLSYEFIYSGAAADAHDWFFDAGSDTNFFIGGVVSLDVGGTPEVVVVYSDGNSNSTLDLDTPAAGTSVKFYCDGTNWYVNGTVVSAAAPAFADQA